MIAILKMQSGELIYLENPINNS